MSEMQISERCARPVLGLVLVLAVLVMAACSGSEPPAVPQGADGSQDPVLVIGREVYGQQCASCHAADGSGKRGPRLSGGRVVEHYPDSVDQVTVVATGRGGMPAFESKLTPAEIDAVVRYTREVL